jgi:hypothetical protein
MAVHVGPVQEVPADSAKEGCKGYNNPQNGDLSLPQTEVGFAGDSCSRANMYLAGDLGPISSAKHTLQKSHASPQPKTTTPNHLVRANC